MRIGATSWADRWDRAVWLKFEALIATAGVVCVVEGWRTVGAAETAGPGVTDGGTVVELCRGFLDVGAALGATWEPLLAAADCEVVPVGVFDVEDVLNWLQGTHTGLFRSLYGSTQRAAPDAAKKLLMESNVAQLKPIPEAHVSGAIAPPVACEIGFRGLNQFDIAWLIWLIAASI
jgi:hypothetical protein